MDICDDHALPILTADGSRCLMPAQAVGRSKLLQELLRHAQEPEALMVPIGSIAVKEWTEYVQRSQEGAFKASEDAQKMDIDAMQRLLLVCSPATASYT